MYSVWLSGAALTTQILPYGCGRATPYPEQGGQNSSIALNQTGYGAILRVHWGALDRIFRAPDSPGSALSVGNHCFGPSGAGIPAGPETSFKKVSKLNQR